MRDHRGVAWLAAGALAFTLVGCSRATTPARRNVLLIVVDTLRADRLGYHGHTRETSPHLDRLARESAVFQEHQAHASRTEPSVASLLTSLHVRSHGVVNPLDQWDGKGVLADERLTLAEVLKEQGYHARALVANPNLHPRFGFGQGFDVYGPVPTEAPAAIIFEAAARWLDELPEPFFLYLHVMDPHSPYTPPGPLPAEEAEYSGPFDGSHGQLDALLAGSLVASEADRRHLSALYDAEVAGFDAAFGGFLERLERSGRGADSILVVTADHGEELFEHGGVLHGYTLYREQLHVPLLFHAPGLVAAAELWAPSRGIDVFPTLLELLDLPAPPGLQGTSLLPLLRGGDARPQPMLAETSLRAVKTVRVRSFEDDGYKLVETLVPAEVADQLFDTRADAAEARDLAATRPDEVRRMKQALAAYLDGLPEAAASSTTLDSETLEKLRSLGYVEAGPGR